MPCISGALDILKNISIKGDVCMHLRKIVFVLTFSLAICLIISACVDNSAETEFLEADSTEHVETEPASRPRSWRTLGIPGFVDPSEYIVLTGEIETYETGIRFSLTNLSKFDFIYGESWELAHFVNESWRPVDFRPDFSPTLRPIIDIGYSLYSGETKDYQMEWGWIFGELPPGEYMFIRRYDKLGHGSSSDDVLESIEFIMLEFVVINGNI